MKKYLAAILTLSLAMTATACANGSESEAFSDTPLELNAGGEIGLLSEPSAIPADKESDKNGSAPPVISLCVGESFMELSTGNYTWETVDPADPEVTAAVIACGVSPYDSYISGICPVADLDGEKCVTLSLPEDAEIIGVYCCDGEGKTENLTFDKGTLTLPESPNGMAYCVSVKFPEGEAEYFFGGKTPESTADASGSSLNCLPPELSASMTYDGEGGEPRRESRRMGIGSYSWDYTDENGEVRHSKRSENAYELYSGYRAPAFDGSGELLIELPDGAEVTGVKRVYFPEDEGIAVDFEMSGSNAVIPVPSSECFCCALCVSVAFDGGNTCDYVLGGTRIYSTFTVTLKRMVNIGGTVYAQDGEQPTDSEIIQQGEITDVEEGQIPARSGRSNFGACSYRLKADGTADILCGSEGVWTRFTKLSDDTAICDMTRDEFIAE